MTTRQTQRLQLAERVCRIAMRHRTCGLVESEGYRPDVSVGLRVMQREAEKLGDLKAGSLDWLGKAAEDLQDAIFEWMKVVGLDPQSQDKAEAKLMVMEMAQEVFGSEYEGEISQTDKSERKWVERRADDRAADIAREVCAGRIKGFEEVRMAIAADILEAEHVARDPFVKFAMAMHDAVKNPDASEGLLTRACAGMLSEAWRWLSLEPKERADFEAAAACAAEEKREPSLGATQSGARHESPTPPINQILGGSR